MPVIYKGKKLLTPEEYESGYATKHPNKTPKHRTVVKRNPRLNRNTYLTMASVVVAINILSGGHTIPTMASLYEGWSWFQYIIAVAGFIGIEGALLFLMAQPERGEWEKRSIFIAFLAAIATNVYAVVSLEIASQSNQEFLRGIGVFLGVVVPVLNLAFGEVMHRLSVKRNNELEEIELEYRMQLLDEDSRFDDETAKYNDSWQKAYRAFLTRMGFTTIEDREYIMSGFAEIDYLAGEMQTPEVSPLEPAIPEVPQITEKEESFLQPLNPQ